MDKLFKRAITAYPYPKTGYLSSNMEIATLRLNPIDNLLTSFVDCLSAGSQLLQRPFFVFACGMQPVGYVPSVNS